MRRLSTGFSLIEMLAVLFVISMVIGGAMLAVSNGGIKNNVGKEVERFTAYSEYASELAVISGETVGLVLEPPAWRDSPTTDGWRYRWQTISYEGWTDVEGMPAIEFDPELDLGIKIEDQLWVWNPNEKPEIITPIIAFYPGGDVTPFEIEFTHEEDLELSEHVEVDIWGNIVWREKAEIMQELKDKFE